MKAKLVSESLFEYLNPHKGDLTHDFLTPLNHDNITKNIKNNNANILYDSSNRTIGF